MDATVKTMDPNAEAGLTAIEQKFPHIAKVLCELWGKEDYAAYVKSLVFDERGGRQGFPPDVSTELFTLYQLLDFKSEGDAWTESDNSL